MPLLCVGERRSATAIRRGWTWADGHLAAKTLQQAMAALELTYGHDYLCCNVLDDHGVFYVEQMKEIAVYQQQGWSIVALGKKAAHYLAAYQIPHVTLIHPAARGMVRTRQQYEAHVVSILTPILRRTDDS